MGGRRQLIDGIFGARSLTVAVLYRALPLTATLPALTWTFMLLGILAVALGSAVGGSARFVLSVASIRWFGPAFPYGTLAINVAGSFLIGWIFTATAPGARWETQLTTRQFLMSGICGGFTTFSAFSLETLNLARDGETGRAVLYVMLSLVLCVLAA